MTEDTVSEKAIWSNVLILMLSWIIWGPFQGAVWIYFQAFLKEIGATPSIIALISSVTTLAIIFSRFIGGYVADIIGRRKMIVIFTFFIAFSYYAYTWFLDWRWVLAVGVFSNLCLLYQPALNAIIADSIPEKKRGKGYMILRLSAISSIFAPVVAMYVLMLNNNDIIRTELTLFMLAFISGLVVSILRVFGLQETIRPIKLQKIPSELVAHFALEYKKTLWYMLKHMKLYLLVRVFFASSIGLTALTQYYALYYLNVGYDVWALAVFISNIVGFLSSIIAGFLTDSAGRKIVALIGSALGTAGYYILATAPQGSIAFSHLLIAFLLTSIMWGFVDISFSAMWADLMPITLRGKGFAILAALLDGTVATTTMLAGFLYEQIHPRYPFLLAVIMMFITTIISFFLKETLKKSHHVKSS